MAALTTPILTMAIPLIWQLEEDDKPEPVCFVAHASRTDVIQVTAHPQP